MKKITVLLSDDHTLVREGLRFLLEAAGDIQVVGEAENGRQAVWETKRLQPDVVLLDLAMPLLNGVEATRQIIKEVPGTKVLILSGYSDDQHVQHAIEAGAAGYLMKETAGQDLLRAIREVQRGSAFFSPPISKGLVHQWQKKFVNGRPVRSSVPSLTGRQTEVVQLIAEGYSSKQIAGLLSVTKKTVERHRQTIMDKLDIHEIATLTRYAVSTGVVESNYRPNWPVSATAAPVHKPA